MDSSAIIRRRTVVYLHKLANKNKSAVLQPLHRSTCEPALHTHTHPFNGPFSRTTQVSRYQQGKTNLDLTEAREGEWQWLQLGHVQVCTSLQTDNHASTPPLSFLQAGCPSCHATNSVKALKASVSQHYYPFNYNCNCTLQYYICTRNRCTVSHKG